MLRSSGCTRCVDGLCPRPLTWLRVIVVILEISASVNPKNAAFNRIGIRCTNPETHGCGSKIDKTRTCQSIVSLSNYSEIGLNLGISDVCINTPKDPISYGSYCT